MQFTEKHKSQLLVIGFLGAVGLVVALYFHFMIGRHQTQKYLRQTTTLETQIKEARADLADIKELLTHKDELKKKQAMIAKVTERLPNSPDAPGFLLELISVLRKTSIIQEMVRSDTPQNQIQYTEIPYTVEAHGRYHEIGQFLTLIEQNPKRFMRIKSFSIENNLERPSVHPVDMKIATFMFNN